MIKVIGYILCSLVAVALGFPMIYRIIFVYDVTETLKLTGIGFVMGSIWYVGGRMIKHK